MHAREIAAAAFLIFQRLTDGMPDVVIGETSLARLGIPVDVLGCVVKRAFAVGVEVGCLVLQSAKRISKRRQTLAGLYAAEIDLADVLASAGCATQGCGAEEHGARYTTRGRVASERAVIPVNGQRRRIGTVDISLDNRRPGGLQISRQLFPHRRLVYRDHAWQNEQVSVFFLPELVDDRGHEAQDATGTLKPVERGPVRVEPVEHLRVNRIRRGHPFLIFGRSGVDGEFLIAGAVGLDEGSDDVVALAE